MRIATWNVNSIRTRKHLVIDYLHSADIDVVAMQETKCKDDQFPFDDFEEAGYEVAHFGLNQWNGVAIASRLPLEDVEQGFARMPGFRKTEAEDLTREARAISATIDGVRLWSVYVPNGRSLEDPHYLYKLEWIEALGQAVRDYAAQPGSLPYAIAGDFNIAVLPEDVGDPDFLQPGVTHTSEPERRALQDLLEVTRTRDLVRPFQPEGFTFWDYKQGKFQKNQGLRIDFIFGSPECVDRVSFAEIAASQRKGDAPSDHVPVVIELTGDDDEDRPMVF